MSSPTNASGWQDRRGMFQGGRAVHEPAKGPFVPKAFQPAVVSPTSPTTTTSSSTDSSTAERRRRSSASGTAAGMFSNLHSQKRGSTDYGVRKESWSEQAPTKGPLGSFFDKVVKK